MQAGRATTGNYYGALRTDASDGTAETDIPDPLPEGYLHHLPSEVLAIVLHYLTTAARIPFCDAGDRLRLTRMTQSFVRLPRLRSRLRGVRPRLPGPRRRRPVLRGRSAADARNRRGAQVRESEDLVSAAAAPRSRPAQDLLVLPAAGRPRAVLDLWRSARVVLLLRHVDSPGHTN